MSETKTPHVYFAINRVQAELAKRGVSKNQQITGSFGYKFRGIDDVYNALAPILADNNLIILPRIMKRDCTERSTAKGGLLQHVILHIEYDFISSLDGSTKTLTAIGEAMDSGDKATPKAMTAAYKYLIFEAFCIPIEGSPDADAEVHEVADLINEEQLAELMTGLNFKQIAVETFCKQIGIEKLDQLAASRFKGALKYIKGL